MCGTYLADHHLGPAGQWMIEHLGDSFVRDSPITSGAAEKASTRTQRADRRSNKRMPASGKDR
jgi:hypothetical protein